MDWIRIYTAGFLTGVLVLLLWHVVESWLPQPNPYSAVLSAEPEMPSYEELAAAVVELARERDALREALMVARSSLISKGFARLR